MQPIVVANIESVYDTPFVCAVLYGDDGYLRNSLILPVENDQTAIETICRLIGHYGYFDAEVRTSTPDIYRWCIGEVALSGRILHPSDTAETKRTVKEHAEVLAEIHGLIPPPVPEHKPPLPHWRAKMAKVLHRLLKIIEGDGKYDIT